MRSMAPSADLFAPAPSSVASVWTDAEGGVRWFREAVAAERADAWFQALRDTVPWAAQRRPMYDRVVDVPRLLASYALVDAAPVPGSGHAWVVSILAHLREVLATSPPMSDLASVPYDSVGLNLYRDGRDSVALHHDTLRHLAPRQPILLLSLGATRRMTLRANVPPHVTRAVDLGAGDLLAMSHASQLTHRHGIAKTARAVGPRISLAFRVGAGWSARGAGLAAQSGA